MHAEHHDLKKRAKLSENNWFYKTFKMYKIKFHIELLIPRKFMHIINFNIRIVEM